MASPLSIKVAHGSASIEGGNSLSPLLRGPTASPSIFKVAHGSALSVLRGHSASHLCVEGALSLAPLERDQVHLLSPTVL